MIIKDALESYIFDACLGDPDCVHGHLLLLFH